MRRLRSTLAAAGLAPAVLLAGCGDPDNPSAGQQAPSTTSQPTTSTTAATGSASAEVAAPVRALQTAARAVPQGKAFGLDPGARGGQRVWDVNVASGQRQFDLDVTADGARVLRRREDPTPDDDVRKLRSVRVDAARAVRLAGQHQGGQLTDLDLDTTDAGTVVWEVDFRQPDGSTVTVSIHARTGELLETSGD